MSKDTDEPLEGDIGPASAHRAKADPWATGAPAPEEDAASTAAELLLYEAEREERRRRTNALSGRIAFVLAAVLLAFLMYDSVHTAVRAQANGDDWIYPPAVNAGICGIALVVLAAWAVRRRRARR